MSLCTAEHKLIQLLQIVGQDCSCQVALEVLFPRRLVPLLHHEIETQSTVIQAPESVCSYRKIQVPV